MTISNLFLILGALPLLAYPGVLLAGVMSLAAPRSGDEPIWLIAATYSFLLASLAYPIVFAVCVVYTRNRAERKDYKGAFRFSIAPFGYLLLVSILFVTWIGADEWWRNSQRAVERRVVPDQNP